MADAEGAALTLETPGDAAPLRLLWRPLPDEPGEPTSPWTVEGEIDAGSVEALRLVSAVFEDGRELALAALRPRGGAGHDADHVALHLLGDGEPIAVSQALLSTEYDARGMPRRLGIELWTSSDQAPLRVAADRESGPEVSEEGLRRQATPMSFRLDGTAGSGLYEVLSPA